MSLSPSDTKDYQAVVAYLAPGLEPRSGAFDTPTWNGPDQGGAGTAHAFPLINGGSIASGSVGYGQVDQTPPAMPTGLTLSSAIIQTPTGPVVALIVSLTQPADSDLSGCWVEITSELSGGNPVYTHGQRAFIPAAETSVTFTSVMALTDYYARAQSTDWASNFSNYTSNAGPTTTVADTVAPAVPTNLTLLAGFRAIGCTWSSNTEPDLDHYDVRWASDDGTGSAPQDAWTQASTYSNVYVIPNAETAIKTYVQVRAVDRSGNPSAWSNDVGSYVSTTATLISGSDVVAVQAVIDFLTAGTLTASVITSGQLTVAGSGAVSGIVIKDASTPPQIIGRWDDDGLVLYDPADVAHRWLSLAAGEITMVNDGSTVAVGITPDGINAAAVNFGVAVGAPNEVSNSSFELSPPVVTSTATITAFGTEQTAAANVTVGVGSVTVTAW